MSDLVDVMAPSDEAEGTRSQVLAWLKAVGDTVSENEPLLEIETDKVTVELPAPCSGVLREILIQAPTEIEPGAVLGRIDRAAGAPPAAGNVSRQLPEAERAHIPAAAAPQAPAVPPRRPVRH